ncbi:MAG: hypothetical protein QF921_04965 [Pseudomonadales bacterium]|nr:hypothetical protein [Pseudomonadales bacterium]MDP6471861.1 hypothetical protein [Pseudomonadales bacterium]MDP6826869.1 hypothetical protein [Pseudomonadales bacterium]MDP6970853.1 hypothetical protein [Pseudomonadales bacterium]
MLLALVAVGANAAWHTREDSAMGTRIGAELWHADAVLAKMLLDRVMAEMHRIDGTFSAYRDDSEL